MNRIIFALLIAGLTIGCGVSKTQYSGMQDELQQCQSGLVQVNTARTDCESRLAATAQRKQQLEQKTETYSQLVNSLQEEINSFVGLIVSKTAQNLIRVFLLSERLKSLGKAGEYNPKHVHVIGGGVMGGDIAAWCALRGFKVTLQDREMETLAKVKKRA